MALKILVADAGDPRGRQALWELLHLLGHEVVVAESGSRWLPLVDHGRFDVVIVEVTSLSATELHRLGKTGPADRARPSLIALSSVGRQRDRRRARSGGFIEYLVKPVDIERLLAVLRRVENGEGVTSCGAWTPSRRGL